MAVQDDLFISSGIKLKNRWFLEVFSDFLRAFVILGESVFLEAKVEESSCNREGMIKFYDFVS